MLDTPAAPAIAALDSLSPDQRQVLEAFALGATPRARSWVLELFKYLGVRNAAGRSFSVDELRDRLAELARAGWLVEHPHRQGFRQIPGSVCSQVLLPLIDRGGVARLRSALAAVEHFDESPRGVPTFRNEDAAIAILRLEMFSGIDFADVRRLRAACRWTVEWDRVLSEAVSIGLDSHLLKRLDPELQRNIVFSGLARQTRDWIAGKLPVLALARDLLARSPGEAGAPLRMMLCEHLVWAASASEVGAIVDEISAPLCEGDGPEAPYNRALGEAVRAAALVRQGRWQDAERGYEAALATLKKETQQRKNLLPELLLLPYVMSLLAQQSPAHLERAAKFCLAESGKRTAAPDTPWGLMAMAIQMRGGGMRRELSVFEVHGYDAGYVDARDLWKWLMRAWLKEGDKPTPPSAPERKRSDILRQRLAHCGLHGLAAQVEAAVAVLDGAPTPADFFVPAAQESWRVALAALAAITAPAAGTTPAGGADTGEESRLIWSLVVGEDGALTNILPSEQKRGARGWNKPREISLTRLAKTETLAPHDAAVARCIKQTAYASAREQRLDLAAAIMALVGHPHVEFLDRPGVPVTLAEGAPQIDVVDAGESVKLHILPPPRGDDASSPWVTSSAEHKAFEALQNITVLRESPQRARVVRFTPAQRRVALLVDKGLTLPRSAAAELHNVLRGLGAHFQVHADAVDDASPGALTARQVEASSTLRAELAPQGDGLTLRLVVAPFGIDGPRLAPGSGRARMMASVKGETLSVQRALATERAHLDAVLDACPMLPSDAPGDASASFTLLEADEALALVETLPKLGAVEALDWPAGRGFRVDTAGLGQLHVQVRSANEWLTLSGGVQVDEALVFSLEQLLQWGAGSKGRFVPLGDGRYLALTQELRQRIDELARSAEQQRGQTRVTSLAASWLEATLEGASWQADAAFTRRIEQLEAAQATSPALPAALLAELRPYQFDGYQWAMRLAEAGFGAILADDMGLGKTLQALAVLLARAGGGAALVVAPTSLVGNWLAEARRFAPSLNVMVYAGSEREMLAQRAGAHDVVLASYQLVQMNPAAFAEREWHTMVLDEAQALKNAAAKRTQAVQGLRAACRLALSGTPIENRLAELWSIMRICNPGLLGNLARFNERFGIPIERDRDRTAQRTLRRLVGPFILRRTKAQVLDDLPPRTELTLTVQSEPAERAHYEALRRQAVESAEQSLASDAPGQAQLNILAQLTRLRRAACDPRLVSPQLGLVGAKVTAFAELASELVANGHKALVFSQFVDFLALLREPLDAAGIAYQYLDGSTPMAERTRRVAAFQQGVGELFLISLKAGGFGLNLTLADYVVIADPWWNPAAEDQASGRAHRIGQLRPVTVYRLVHGGTLEERIVALHQQKRELAESVLEGSEGGGVLRAEELVALIQGG